MTSSPCLTSRGIPRRVLFDAFARFEALEPRYGGAKEVYQNHKVAAKAGSWSFASAGCAFLEWSRDHSKISSCSAA